MATNVPHPPRQTTLHASRARRLSLAVALGLSLALASTAMGLAADPASPSPDASAHNNNVAAAVDAALGGASTGTVAESPMPTASPAVRTGSGASGSPAPAPVGRSGGSSAVPSLPASHDPPRPTPTPVPTPTPPPTPTPSPTPSPTPNITPPPRAATVDAAVPSSVLKSLSSVVTDYPTPYRDGCHVGMGGTMPSKSCLYGNLSSHTTIAIYGDSHALSWFPAIMQLVTSRGWRLLQVTMSACTPSDITPYAPSTGVMTACIAFRKAAIAKLAKYRPTVIIVTGTRGFETVDKAGHVLTGTARTTAWVAGMYRTINALLPVTSRLVLMADTPNSRFTAPATCLANNKSHELACATPVARAISYDWINTELHVALRKRVAFIDPELWVCPTSPCPLVIGTSVLYRNTGHITATYAATMWRKAAQAVDAILAKPGAIVGP